MPRRIEWRFTEDTRLSIGHWYEAFGDPANESLLTLTQVIRITDNPVWCLTEHAGVVRQVVTAADELIRNLDEAMPDSAESGGIDVATPMGQSVLNAHNAVRHVTMLLIDALVECRLGRMDSALRNDAALAADTLYVLADALNTQAWLVSSLRYEASED